MAIDPRSLDFKDPFAGSSLLSLLPRTLGVPLHAEAPPSEEQEMKSIQDFLDSFILSGSKTVLQQAQAIRNSSQEVVDSSREEKTISPGGKDRLLGRRPALGRKRPRFSLKPIPSNSIPDVDVNSQIDHVDDPEEYFMALDKLENADKEIKKLRGEIPNEDANNHHITVRKRRPGILGKTASFKHQSSEMAVFSSSQDLDRTAMSLELSINSNSNEKSNTLSGQACNLDSMEPNNKVSVATEQEDSAGDNDNNGNNLLEKLLYSFKDLDEAEGTALLKESLQIKSIEVGKICLLELDNIQKNDNKTLKDGVVRKRLEACQLKQKSPTIATSPLAAISNLLRRTSVNDLMENPYLNFPSDGARDGSDFSPISCQQKKSLSPTVGLEVSCPDPNADTSMPLVSDNTSSSLVDKLQTPVTKTDKINDDNIVAEEEETESGRQLHENTTTHRHHEMTEEQSNSEGFNKQIKDKAEHIPLDQLSDQPDPGGGGLASCCVNNNGLASTLGITDEDHMISGEDNAHACGIVDISQTQVNVGTPNIESSAGPCKENLTYQTTVLPLDEQHKGVSISARDVEKHGYATFGISQNNIKSQKAPLRSKNKKLQEWVSKRKSLAASGAGTKWESGLRRSTRNVFRPLEYWRGERFLYGRIHDSLTTVIGVKYCSSSPGQDGRMKVKSYVSEQYADLVAQAARY